MTVALYPGSFDPVHNGHLAMVAAAARLFDKVIVAVGHNPAKPSGLFTGPERVALIEQALADLDHAKRVEVALFEGLVTVAAADLGADCLVKGLRSGSDLDVELLQANMNAETSSPAGLPTVFLPALGTSALISSRYVREIGSKGGDVGSVVPDGVAVRLKSIATGGSDGPNGKGDGP